MTAFAAATILPIQSEAARSVYSVDDYYPIGLLDSVASPAIGPGSVVYWLLGRSVERFRERRWFPVKPATNERTQVWYHHYGKWSLLLSWAPIIGDPLTIVAGILREPLWVFLALVSFAKIGRYLLATAAAVSIA